MEAEKNRKIKQDSGILSYDRTIIYKNRNDGLIVSFSQGILKKRSKK